MIGLTPLQARAMAYLRRYHAKRGMFPTLREMAPAIGVRSTSRVSAVLKDLQTRGHIRRLKGRARAIELIDTADRALVLPVDVEKRLAAFCARHRERRENVISDAVTFHLDELETEEEPGWKKS